MGIFTALAFWGLLAALMAVVGVPMAICRRCRERREWKMIRAAYYPKTTW